MTDAEQIIAAELELALGLPWHEVEPVAKRIATRLASTSPAPDGCDYAPGRLDREAPSRVWLQIDTGGNNDERDEPWPGPEHVTWQDESIGGLEIQYVRADLAAPQPVVEKDNE